MSRPTYDELFQNQGQPLSATILSGKNVDGTDFLAGTSMYVWDVDTLSWIPWVPIAVSGGSGGAATIANGADVTEGTTADAAVDTDTTGTISGKLRGVVKLLASVITGGKVTVDNSGVTQPISAIALPLPSGAATSSAQATLLTELQAKADLTETQPVSVASLPLPSGAANQTKQDTGNTSLASIDGKITAVNTGAVVVSSSALPSGAATEAGNLATIAAKDFATQTTLALIKAKTDNLDVALSTRTKPADAQHAIVDSSALPSGAATSALQTQPGVDIGDVTVNNGTGVSAVNIQDGGNSITIDATALPLPTLASTSTKQSDGSQKSQIVDGSGNVIGATSNALDINIKSGNPTTITVTQATAGNLNVTEASAAEILSTLALEQGADSTDVTGPMVQALVNDAPQSFLSNTFEPLSLTSEGRLRVSSVDADLTRAWQHTLTNPWGDENSPWNMKGWI